MSTKVDVVGDCIFMFDIFKRYGWFFSSEWDIKLRLRGDNGKKIITFWLIINDYTISFKMKQNQFKKRRITPLALLSQVKKNSNQLSFGSDSTFHLNDIKEKPKHNHRYTEEEI